MQISFPFLFCFHSLKTHTFKQRAKVKTEGLRASGSQTKQTLFIWKIFIIIHNNLETFSCKWAKIHAPSDLGVTATNQREKHLWNIVQWQNLWIWNKQGGLSLWSSGNQPQNLAWYLTLALSSLLLEIK